MPRDAERNRISSQERPLTSGKGSGGGGNNSSGTPSESGESHEIKFTKEEGCSVCTCACVFLAVAFVALGSAAGIYFGLQFLSQSRTTDRVFKGKLSIIEGDQYIDELSDSTTKEFQDKSELYKNKLDTLFNNSVYKDAFRHSEILALDKSETGKKLVVHFNLHMNPEKSGVDAGDLYFVLSEEVMRGSQKGVFKGLKIDHQTLHVQERKLNPDNTGDPWSPRRHYPGSLVGLTTPSSPGGPRKCGPITLDFCRELPYNSTSYPNVVKHIDFNEVEKEGISYRQIIDFECYALAKEFVCNVLQPKCVDDKMIPPCRDYCEDFKKGCKHLLPKEVDEKLNCSTLPIFGRNESCSPKPGCADELRHRGKNNFICDGILDCPDFSDETDCEFCKPGQFHCGTRQCVDQEKRCDNRKDCENGADESGCVLLDNLSTRKTTNGIQNYVSEGFVTWRDQNVTRRICLENVNGSLSLARRDVMLRHIATSTCTQLHYRSAEMVETRIDPNLHSLYSKLVEPLSFPATFMTARCSRHQAVYLKCSGLECGIRPASVQLLNMVRSSGADFLERVSHGDWPWHVVLYQNGHHECDATLIAERWLLAPSKCFDKGQYTNWTADLGQIRLSSSSPFLQQRNVQRVLKSPEYRSHLTLLRLEAPANMSDYVRPACLPKLQKALAPGSVCYSFVWANKQSLLQQVQLRIRDLDECQNSSSYSNVLCASATGNTAGQDCLDEETLPMPLLCQIDHKWTLSGLATGHGVHCKDLRIPHLYHRLDTHVQWASHIITADT